MTARLLGTALATAWLLSMSSAAWAQRHGGGRHDAGHGQRRTGTTVVVHSSGGSRVVTAGPSPFYFSQPYYAFRPRQHVGFGLYLGYPVAYPSASYYARVYPNPYGYYPYTPVIPTYAYSATPAYPYAPSVPTYPYSSPVPTYPVYGYASSSAVTVSPGSPGVPAGGTQQPSATGGVSFEITPGNAALFVDGVYVGTADNFSAKAPPLLLSAGRHHFELRAQNVQPMAFDVDVAPGQVVPYRGTLQP